MRERLNIPAYIKFNAHGRSFEQWAAKINAVEGADFVTKMSNEATLGETSPFIVLLKEQMGRISWA